MRAVTAFPQATLLAADAAIAAWRAVSSDATSRVSASIISDSKKSIVVRLYRSVSGERAIIAKRAARAVVLHEAYLYERLLPASGVVAPHFFGVGGDREPSMAWLFIGDVPGVEYDRSNREHAALAAQWLASLHASLSYVHADTAVRLPRLNADTYLAHLRRSRVALQRRLAGADAVEARAILRRGIRISDELERRWPQVAELSRLLPSTLVHGDLGAENVRIAGEEVHVFDWEKAGWGPPLVDIARVDLETYGARAQVLWRVPAADIARGASCGAIFRTLSHRWDKKPLSDVDLFCRRLAREMRSAGLGGALA